jgi:hypothetical protein
MKTFLIHVIASKAQLNCGLEKQTRKFISLVRVPFLFLFIAVMTISLSACRRSLDVTEPVSLPGTPTVSSQAPATTTLPLTQTQGANTSPTTAATETLPPIPMVPASPTPLVLPNLLAVFDLAEGDVLNVRASASASAEIIETLDSGTRDIKPTGRTEDNDGIRWVEIRRSNGEAGWVSSGFVVEQVPPDIFCLDPRVGQVLDQFILAIRAQDGTALTRLVSPIHGLRILHYQTSTPVVLDDEAISNLFLSTTDYEWGEDPASGMDIVGPFKDIILPNLLDVLNGSATRYCNTLEKGLAIGNTAAQLAWPYDYSALNYVALARPAPADQELNWRTCAAGIDYVGGTPYLAVLVQYYYTP